MQAQIVLVIVGGRPYARAPGSLPDTGSYSGWVLEWGYRFGTTSGIWYVEEDLNLAQYIHIAIVYDRSSTSNDPEIWIDGVSKTVRENATPAGTVKTGIDTIKFGENVAGGDDFTGRVAEWAHWNKDIGDHIPALAAGLTPDHFMDGLVAYCPMVSDFREQNTRSDVH